MCLTSQSLFLLTGAIEEIKCPIGTLRETPGAYYVDTHCLACPAGSYCLEGSATTSGQCSPGYYCPLGLTNPYGSHPLLIGSYGKEQVQ